MYNSKCEPFNPMNWSLRWGNLYWLTSPICPKCNCLISLILCFQKWNYLHSSYLLVSDGVLALAWWVQAPISDIRHSQTLDTLTLHNLQLTFFFLFFNYIINGRKLLSSIKGAFYQSTLLFTCHLTAQGVGLWGEEYYNYFNRRGHVS